MKFAYKVIYKPTGADATAGRDKRLPTLISSAVYNKIYKSLVSWRDLNIERLEV